MTKRTLIERMTRRKAPKSWIAEVKSIYRMLNEKNIMIGERTILIDTLAREKETLVTRLDVAHYQIIRAVGQLNSYDNLPVDKDAGLIESVAAQLEAYLEVNDEEITAD